MNARTGTPVLTILNESMRNSPKVTMAFVQKWKTAWSLRYSNYVGAGCLISSWSDKPSNQDVIFASYLDWLSKFHIHRLRSTFAPAGKQISIVPCRVDYMYILTCPGCRGDRIASVMRRSHGCRMEVCRYCGGEGTIERRLLRRWLRIHRKGAFLRVPSRDIDKIGLNPVTHAGGTGSASGSGSTNPGTIEDEASMHF
jgi:hypothetical protein